LTRDFAIGALVSPAVTLRNSFYGGAVVAVGCVAVMAGALALRFESAEYASPTLLRELAQIGVGFLIAYSIALVSAERIVSKIGGAHEYWLGLAAAFGCCGLLGIVVALGVAEHRAAGHAWLLDDLGLWWTVASVGFLGIFVATMPVNTYRWRKEAAASRKRA
jgi:hypothetical protein